jgi:(2Fe-2S) ferredoxin
MLKFVAPSTPIAADADSRPGAQPRVRIFVCVHAGSQGKPSCASRGSRELLAAIRSELTKQGIPAREIDVRPSGCLDECKKGPVAMAFSGAAAGLNKPPGKLSRNLFQRPGARFTRVDEKDAAQIVEQLIQKYFEGGHAAHTEECPPM